MNAKPRTNQWRWIVIAVLLLATAWQPSFAQDASTRSETHQVFLPMIQQQGNAAESSELTEPAMDISALPMDGEISFGTNRVFATISLDNQSVLHFVQFDSGDVALLEEAPEGALSIGSIPELDAKASVADLFYAFAEPGTVPPAEILATAPLTATTKVQGWARALVAPSVTAAQLKTGNCNDKKFRNALKHFGYNDRGTPNFRLNQTPRSSNYFSTDHYVPGNGLTYNFYKYAVGGNDGSIWYDVDRYATRVAVCAIDSAESTNPQGRAHPSVSYQGYSNPHMGPGVWIQYRRPGESVWQTAAVRDFAANQVGMAIEWHFYTGSNWDWRTHIYWAGADDSFDIGHAVEDL